MTQARVPLAGVIGSPVSQSRSPMLHAYWLRLYGIRGYYIPMDVGDADLKAALKSLPKLGFVGVNVTIPHKERVLGLADLITDRAALIGAANTLVFRADAKVYADNTDGYGFIENLRQNAPGWSAADGPAAVLGAGGGARAVVASLLESGASEVRISNRTRPRAEALRADFGPRVVVCDWGRAGEMIEGARTVVNTTSLGMEGQSEFRIPLDALSRDAVVTDLVYSPLVTPILDAATQRGCRVVDGLGMLLHQAAPGFGRWFGVRPIVDAATRAAVLPE
jgi:shikimate dehydrogenase